MNNPLRWPVLTLLAFISACLAPGPLPDGIYAVPDRAAWLEFRPVEPKRYVSGLRVSESILTYIEVYPEAMSVVVTNPTRQEMTLRWNQSAVVIDGESHPALMVREGFDCRNPGASTGETVIPPGQSFRGFVVAADHIAWRQFSPEINEKDYPPGYWLAVGLKRAFQPEQPELHGGYCERKDFFPLSAKARSNASLQRAELEAIKNRRVALFLRFSQNGEEWNDTYEYVARRIVDAGTARPCFDQPNFDRYVADILAQKSLRKPLKSMKLGECGYEY